MSGQQSKEDDKDDRLEREREIQSILEWHRREYAAMKRRMTHIRFKRLAKSLQRLYAGHDDTEPISTED